MMEMTNPAREALTRAVNSAMARGAPAYVNQPAHVGTFTIRQHVGGEWSAIDRCTFNNWGSSERFATYAEAADWSERADAFKRGKRQTF
jgi:hypothetical protein